MPADKSGTRESIRGNRVISRYCANCDKEYRVLSLDDGGLCGKCEQDALNRFNLPSWRDAFGIVILVAVIFALLIVLGSSEGWS